MTKQEKQTIKKLKKEKKYEEIFRQFGRETFIECVDKKYRKNDIAKLKKEGKFEDIYLKYGESEYNDLLYEAKQREIELEYGKSSFKAIANKIQYKIKKWLYITLYSISYSIGSFATNISISFIACSEITKLENGAQYDEIISEYDKQIDNYADNINKMKLNDLEIFMKLQDDMYKSIKGYGTPKLDIVGYWGIDIGQEDATGVCRNMADDIANKLNAINPKYNARIFAVNVDSEKATMENPDIQRNVYITSTTINSNNWNTKIGIENVNGANKNVDNDTEKTIDTKELITKVTGNHVVVAVDIEKENITLIIDPTNTWLGVFKDGKIIIFNSFNKESPVEMYRTILGDTVIRGIDSLEVPIEYAKSFLNSTLSLEELNEKYGIDAQNEALESARKKEENYIYEESKENDFKNSLKVDIQQNEQSIYTVEEIQELYKTSFEKVASANNPEEVIELADICRKIDYSIKYYNSEQKKIIGKDINYGQRISDRLNLNLSLLRQKIAKQMVETNAVILPDTFDNARKEYLCEAYLQSGEQEQLQDLKVIFDTIEDCYYISNGDKVLSSLKINHDEKGNNQSMSYRENIELTQEEIKKLLQEARNVTEIQDMPTIALGEEAGCTISNVTIGESDSQER